ncbi:MAG: hypothetical protein EA378_00295 [Phycisphaerales bacterium]|nr:MAG: hypothetical protein EA378_00295 [Phycisphaerales bacterium]
MDSARDADAEALRPGWSALAASARRRERPTRLTTGGSRVVTHTARRYPRSYAIVFGAGIERGRRVMGRGRA